MPRSLKPLTETWDCHVHFPYDTAEKGPCRPNNLKEFISELKRAGISRAAGNTWEVINPPNAKALTNGNRRTFDAAAESDGFVIPQVMINPHFVDASIAELDWAVQNGIFYAGEICGYIIKHKYRGRGFRRLMDAAGERGVAVNIHTYDFDQAVKITKAHQRTTFVFAHFAQLAHHNITRITELEPFPNALVDVSGTAVFRTGVPEHAIAILGPKRVLFGTDYFIDEPISTRIRTEIACPDERSLPLVMRENLRRLATGPC